MNMKNSLQLLALGLVLFLGACSNGEPNSDKDPVTPTPPVTPPTIETKFLDKIKGKTVYDHATSTSSANKFGTFSADGQKFTWNSPGEGNPIMTFLKASDENNGEYIIDGNTLVFTTIDGKTGSIKNKDGSGPPPEDLWFK